MSKGIRPFVVETFIALSAKRLAGEFGPIDTYLAAGNTEFRRAVITAAQTKFGISISSGATAYNHALNLCREKHPELAVGLGRPDDKKGGRKPNNSAVAPTTAEQASDAAAGATSAATAPETPVVEAPAAPVKQAGKRANKKAASQVAA